MEKIAQFYKVSEEQFINHILIKMTSDDLNGKMLSVQSGDAFAQGIFLPYGITVDDDADGQREGGFGSTTGK